MKMKKIAAVLSAAALAVTSFSVAAFAADPETKTLDAVSVGASFDENAKTEVKKSEIEVGTNTAVTKGAVCVVTYTTEAADTTGMEITLNGDASVADLTAGTTDQTATIVVSAAADKLVLKGKNVTVSKVTVAGTDKTVTAAFDASGEITEEVASVNVDFGTEILADDKIVFTISGVTTGTKVQFNGETAQAVSDTTATTAEVEVSTADADGEVTIGGTSVTITSVAIKRAIKTTAISDATTITGSPAATDINGTATNHSFKAAEGEGAATVLDGSKLTITAMSEADILTALAKHPEYDPAEAAVVGIDVELSEGSTEGKIEVTLSLGSSFDNATDVKVYHVVGTDLIDMNATVTAGTPTTVKFVTDSFSPYIISTKALNAAAADPNPQPEPQPEPNPDADGGSSSGSNVLQFGTAATTTAAEADVKPADSTTAASEAPATTTATATSTTTGNAAEPGSTGTDKNQPTGVVLAIVPAVIAAAGLAISKKRK